MLIIGFLAVVLFALSWRWKWLRAVAGLLLAVLCYTAGKHSR